MVQSGLPSLLTLLSADKEARYLFNRTLRCGQTDADQFRVSGFGFRVLGFVSSDKISETLD